MKSDKSFKTDKKDPVCGMSVEGCDISFSHGGQDYCFCSAGCRDEFKKSPEDYI